MMMPSKFSLSQAQYYHLSHDWIIPFFFCLFKDKDCSFSIIFKKTFRNIFITFHCIKSGITLRGHGLLHEWWASLIITKFNLYLFINLQNTKQDFFLTLFIAAFCNPVLWPLWLLDLEPMFFHVWIVCLLLLPFLLSSASGIQLHKTCWR